MKLNFPETLKQLRKEKELTQDEVAFEIGVSFQAVSRWENGLSYPDIELLPKLAALFNVSMDTLFGMDSNSELIKEEQYRKEDEELFDIKDKINLAKKYIELSPHNVYFKHRIVDLYCSCGIEYAKSKLAEIRRLCQFIIDHTAENSYIRYRVLNNIICIEDDDHVDIWLSMLDRPQHITRQSVLINRYSYRNESEKYNESIQADIFSHLNHIFARDFCKRDTHNNKIAQSRIIGQNVILNIINVLRNPDTETDAWIKERIYAYLRLSAAYFVSKKLEDGYTALEYCTKLCEIYSDIPDDTVLPFNSPVLDIITETADASKFLPEIYALLTADDCTNQFKYVRNEKRFIELVNRIKVLI